MNASLLAISDRRFVVTTIRNEQLLGAYSDERSAKEALDHFAEQYSADGVCLVRFDPVCRAVVNPKKPSVGQ